MDTIIYTRASLDRTGEELSVTRQGEDGRRLAELRGWTVIGEQVDNDTSAAGKRPRPGFEAVLAALESGAAQSVIAWDMSRLSRNRRDTLRLLEAGERHGAVLAFVRGSDLDLGTPAGQLTADILAGVARHEIAQKGDRQRRANEQARAAGKWTGGRRPFGYERDGVTIRADEAAALRRAYESILSGVSLGQVARDLNAAGFNTPQRRRGTAIASAWTAQTIRPTLLNARYAGLRALGKGKAQEIVAAAVWPAIVEEEVWRAACAIIADPSRACPARSDRALLTGVAECGVCGGPVHRGGTTDGYPTYRCRDNLGHFARRAEPVDAYVGEIVIERLSRPDAADLLHDTKRPDVAALRTEASALAARLTELGELHIDGTITTAQLRAGTERARTRLAEVEAKLADAGRVNVLGPLLAARDIRAAWSTMDTDRQRAIVETLMRVVLHPPGRGTRTFREETVGIIGRTA